VHSLGTDHNISHLFAIIPPCPQVGKRDGGHYGEEVKPRNPREGNWCRV